LAKAVLVRLSAAFPKAKRLPFTCRLAGPAGDWAATVQAVAPESAELAWAGMGFLA